MTEFDDGMKKRKTELPLIREGCWGEYNPGIVVVAGVQPYVPKPQRVVGRLRARKVNPVPLTRPGCFRSQDIRLFMKTKPRAEIFKDAPKINSVSRVPPSEDNTTTFFLFQLFIRFLGEGDNNYRWYNLRQ